MDKFKTQRVADKASLILAPRNNSKRSAFLIGCFNPQ